jgi:two-component system, LuxR family, response regulator FixJ
VSNFSSQLQSVEANFASCGSDSPVIHIVDDESKVRDSLAELLNSVGLCVAAYDSAEEFLARYDSAKPGCLLLDVCMPGMSGLELQERLRARHLDIPWIVITAHADVAMAVKAMTDGASGFLEKPFRSHELLRIIHNAMERDRAARLGQVRGSQLKERFDRLSPRERQVMEMVTTGAANKQIAKVLEISERTVEVHRAKVMKKLSAATLAELINLAAEYHALSDLPEENA